MRNDEAKQRTRARASNLSSFVNELCSIVTSKRKRLEKNRSSDVRRSQLLSRRNIPKVRQGWGWANHWPQSLVRMTKIDMMLLQLSRKISHVSDVFVFDAEAAPVEGSVGEQCCLNQTNERSSSLRRRRRAVDTYVSRQPFLLLGEWMEEGILIILSDVHSIEIDIRGRCWRLLGILTGELFEHADVTTHFTIS